MRIWPVVEAITDCGIAAGWLPEPDVRRGEEVEALGLWAAGSR